MNTPSEDKPDWLKNWKPTPPQPPKPLPAPGGKKYTVFAPGVSGNPKGRPKGLKNKKTKVLAEFERHGSAVAQAAIDAALAGDVSAMGLVLQRIEPVLKARSAPVQFALDPSAPLTEQAQAVIKAVADGKVDPDTVKLLIDSIRALASIKNTDEYEQRLKALEARK